ncbi:MAG: response regulator [Treponema sp.]|nr:response regulator [Treponema sp.]
MDPAVKLLFDYIRDVIYNPAHAVLDVGKLPQDFRDLGEGLKYLGDCILETRRFANALSRGELDEESPSRNNEIAGPLKSLQSSLQHLTWQTQQVAMGDYQQRVDFMGNFSLAFNTMVQQLEERRKKDAEAKSKLQQYVDLLLENFPDIVLLFDIDGKIVSTSKSYLFYSKTEDPEMILNKTFNDLFSSLADDEFLQRMDGFFRTAVTDRRISETDREIDFGGTGNTRHYAIRVTPMLDGQGIVVGTMFVFHDLTELRKTEIAEASNKAKSKFLAMMSHEIRTPMNAILGITEIKIQNETLAPDMAEAFTRIHNSGTILLNLINEVLDLSKIEAGKFELTPVEYEIASFINDSVQLNMMQFKSKPIEFKLLVDEHVPSVLFGDPARIRQILSNLLSNAFKYTREGVIELSIHAEAGNSGADGEATLVFRVSDTGQGMTAEQVHLLFDEYSRFNPHANRKIEGTGLGMNITQHLIQLMNGEISVESELGKGSIFTVRLPQKTIGQDVLGKEMAENLQQLRWSSISRLKKAKIAHEPMPYGSILIVDDIESNLYVAQGLTEPYKLSVDTATSGFEAIEKIRNGNVYDIVFMDHMMPKMDGIEATKIIRGMNYTHPIVALTANALAGQAQMFLANGFNDYLSKPIDTVRLDVLLNKLIRDKQPPETLAAARATAAQKTTAASAAAAQTAAAQAADTRQQTNSQSNKKIPLIYSNPRLLKIFIRDVEKAILTLDEIYTNNFRRDDDTQLYVITVHGMKSALASAGETELSAFALKLEKTGEMKDIATILSETPLFIDGLQELIKKITPKEEEQHEAVNEDRTFLYEKLAIIQASCEAYKRKDAKDALTELRQKNWLQPTQDLLNTITSHLLHGEFEKAAEITRNYLKHA